MKKIIFFLMLVLAFMLENSAFAEKTSLGNTFPSLGRGVRPLGMGNAFLTAKGTDENAIYYNPAAIRDFSNDTKIVFNPVSAEISTTSIQLVKDAFDLADDLDTSQTASGDIDAFEAFVDSHLGKFYNVELRQNLIGAYNKYFAVNIVDDTRVGFSFRNTRFTNFEVKAKGLAGVVGGTAIGFFEDTLELGVAVKVLYGAENEQIVTTSDILANSLNDFDWNNWKRGLGVGGDIGLKYEVPSFGVDWIDTLKPTIAATYQDIGDTRFKLMKKNGGPEKLKQSVSAGLGVHPQFGVIETSIMADLREINVKQDLLMKVNAGAEVRFPKVVGMKFALRGGMNQGYPTGGVGIEFAEKVILNAAYYGKELGEVTRQKAGYRVASELTFRF